MDKYLKTVPSGTTCEAFARTHFVPNGTLPFIQPYEFTLYQMNK